MDEAEFLRRLTVDEATGCYLWMGFRDRDGYGKVRVDGRTVLAHRHAWVLVHGAIPAGLFVCHACDNPPCCNVDHLALGTHADNMADMVTRGRSLKGERHHHARLTAEAVVEIRERAAAGESLRTLARSFGVSGDAVRRAAIGENWRHLGDSTERQSA